jgi:hypothetical protein
MKKHITLLTATFAITVLFDCNAQTFREAFDRLDSNFAYTPNGKVVYGQGLSYSINNGLGGGNRLQINEPPIMHAYINMYKATHDTRYLDKLIIQVHRVQKHRDDNIANHLSDVEAPTSCGDRYFTTHPYPDIPGSKGWSSDQFPDCVPWHQRVLHSAVITFPMAELIYLLKAEEPALQNIPVPGEASQKIDSWPTPIVNYLDFAQWLEMRVNETLQYHNDDWCSTTNLYEKGSSYIHGAGSRCDEISTIPDALNMQCAIGKTLVIMSEVEFLPGGNLTYAKDYSFKYEHLANYLRQAIDQQPQNNFYTWNHDYPGSNWIEDSQHASSPMEFAELNYKYAQRSVFDLHDIQMFANTVANRMYDAPLKFHLNTYGTNSSVYPGFCCSGCGTTITPQCIVNHYSRVCSYAFLAPYNPYIYQIVSDCFDSVALAPVPKTGDSDGADDLVACSYLAHFKNYDNPVTGRVENLLNPLAVKRYQNARQNWKGITGGSFPYKDSNPTGEFATISDNNHTQIWKIEQGSFEPFKLIASSASGYTAIAAGELDPDNDGDEIAAVSGTGLHILKRKGTSIISYGEPQSVFSNMCSHVAAGNFNPVTSGNEILVTGFFNFPEMYSFNSTTNQFTLLPFSGTIPSFAPNSFIAGGNFDLNNPGDEFIIVSPDGNVNLYKVTDSTTTNLTIHLIFSYSIGLSNINGITAGDFDGDGIAECVAHCNDNGGFFILKYQDGKITNRGEEYFKVDQQIGVFGNARMVISPGKDALIILRNYDGQMGAFNFEGFCPGLNLNKSR